MLARASFQNFKALKAVEVDLAPFTVLVGKNGSGKTSILQAIHDVSRVAGGPASELDVVFGGAHDPRRLVTSPGRGPMRIALTDTEGCSLSVEAQIVASDDRHERVRFVVGVAEDGTTSSASPEDATWPEDMAAEVKQPKRHSTGGEAPAGALAKLLSRPVARRFGSAVLLRLDARVMMRESVPSSEEPRLEDDGEGLASVLSYLAGAEPEALEAIRRDLAAVVPEVRAIRTRLVRIERKLRQALTVGDQVVYPSFDEPVMGHRFSLDMGAGRVVPADLLSEGTVLALGLLTALHHPDAPRLVLMDDVDGALHTTAQVELVRCLRSIQTSRPDVQIVCTSHSPDLLDHVSLEEVRVMVLDSEGHARCRRLSDHPEAAKWHKMLRTGEFWSSVGEDWVLEAAGDG